MKVCVSDDYELGFEYSVPFAGFYSCRSGNPLMLGQHSEKKLLKSGHSLGAYLQNSGSDHWPKGCPSGYSQHIATVENSCEIDYCVVADAFSNHGLPPLRQPPYMDIPAEGFEDSLSYSISDDGLTWEIMEPSDSDGPSARGSNPDDPDSNSSSKDEGLSKGAVAGISIVATVACIVVASVAIVKYRQRRSLYRPLARSTTMGSRERTIQSTGSQYGTSSSSTTVLVET